MACKYDFLRFLQNTGRRLTACSLNKILISGMAAFVDINKQEIYDHTCTLAIKVVNLRHLI